MGVLSERMLCKQIEEDLLSLNDFKRRFPRLLIHRWPWMALLHPGGGGYVSTYEAAQRRAPDTALFQNGGRMQ